MDNYLVVEIALKPSRFVSFDNKGITERWAITINGNERRIVSSPYLRWKKNTFKEVAELIAGLDQTEITELTVSYRKTTNYKLVEL